MHDSRTPLRFVACTAAAAAALAAPAGLQAMLVLHPDLVSPDQARAALCFALAGSLVAVPALIQALLAPIEARRSGVRRANA